MTAQPIGPDGSGMWGPDPVRQRPANHTIVAPATAVGVVINRRNTFEPDVVLSRSPVVADNHYADAGIPHYWRIEQNPVHVYAYDLVDGRYELVADSAEELIVTKPFDVRLPIRDITP
ncbi:hypothetical protein [Micromonospora sp. NPDC049891]|uniref:hypothetical protein n=1 Tax=Micromonospora sp. NPDC049891 TaxID=3155655 RepID=UPI0033F1FC6A